MTQQTINIGNQPGDGTGDPARTAFTKVNQNFTEVYANATPGGSTGQIQYKSGATSFGGFTASGDATINSTTGAVSVTKTGGVAFAASATTDTTVAANVVNVPSGTIAATNVQSAINEIVTDLSAFSGSSLVGFLQSGTGAVARTVQAKERDFVSVKDFDAKGDGTTDDTAAFNAALAAADNVFVPAGTYKITSTISIPQNKCLRGVGYKSRLNATIASGAVISITSGQGPTEVTDLRISGTATKGVYVNNAWLLKVNNISLDGLTATDGFVFILTYGSSFVNLWTAGATISNACFVCGQDFNANDSANWYTSNFSTYNVLLDTTYESGSGTSHGSCWSMITCQGGRYGLYVKQYRAASFNGFYSENVVCAVRLGDKANSTQAIAITINGGEFAGPLATHPNYASREACLWFDNALGCKIMGIDFTGSYNFGNAAPVTISGGSGSGAKVIALVTPAGAVHSVQVLCPGTGYTSDPGATVGGAGAGATLTLVRSGTTVGSISVSAAGSGYGTAALVAITYATAYRCSVDSCYINHGSGVISPIYPLLVRRDSSGSTPGSGVMLINDVSLVNAQNGNPANLMKTRSYGYTHALLEYDNTGVAANTTYIPPQYP